MTTLGLTSVAGHHAQVVAATKRYGNATALNSVNLEARPGEFVVLLGPSGSGKSTLVRALAGVERLDGGCVHFGDRVVSDKKVHVPPDRRDLGMVFQDYALWPHLTALGNVAYPLRRRGGAAATRLATLALERVGLDRLADRYPHELSGGEQQRVALARAVVAQPKLLLFDEPLSNLDADLRERLRVEISTLSRQTGATAVYITHDQSEAFALADRIAVLRNGRIEQVAAPEDVYQRPATPFVARFTGLSGELTGTSTLATDDEIAVAIGDRRVVCRSIERVKVGGPVRVLVRPAATALADEGAEQQPNLLAGTVADVAYRGRGYDHLVHTDAGTLAGVFDTQAWSRGQRCQVRIDPNGCFAFPDPGAHVSTQVDENDCNVTDLTAVMLTAANGEYRWTEETR